MLMLEKQKTKKKNIWGEKKSILLPGQGGGDQNVGNIPPTTGCQALFAVQMLFEKCSLSWNIR